MVRARDDKLGRLRALPGYEQVPLRRLRSLAAAADLVSLEPGRVVHRRGQVPRGGLLVLEGAVDLLDGNVRLGTLGPGALVAGDEVLAGRPAATDAVAAGPVTALAFFTPQLRSLFAGTAPVARSA